MKLILLCLSLTYCATSAFADTWILRTADTKVTLYRSTRADGFIPESVGLTNVEWVRIVQEAPPDYNHATQKLVAAAAESGSNPIVRTLSWTITALSQAELDALADAADRLAKRTTVGSSVAALRSWKTDADTAVAAWDAWTTAQRFAALKTLTTRFGTMCDRMADLIQAQRIDQ